MAQSNSVLLKDSEPCCDVQSLRQVRLFVTHGLHHVKPSLSFTISRSLLKLTSLTR